MVRNISFRTNSYNSPTLTGAVVTDLGNLVERNKEVKKLLWSGAHMQIYAMNIPIDSEIGTEVHYDSDQLIQIESGRAKVLLGNSSDGLNYERIVDDDNSIIIAANTWHNIINVGDEPLKLLSIYAKSSKN